MFADNANCGYVLKPEILLNPDLGFDPLDKNTMFNKKLFEVKIISAQQLPKPEEFNDEISDPYGSLNQSFALIKQK